MAVSCVLYVHIFSSVILLSTYTAYHTMAYCPSFQTNTFEYTKKRGLSPRSGVFYARSLYCSFLQTNVIASPKGMRHIHMTLLN